MIDLFCGFTAKLDFNRGKTEWSSDLGRNVLEELWRNWETSSTTLTTESENTVCGWHL